MAMVFFFLFRLRLGGIFNALKGKSRTYACLLHAWAEMPELPPQRNFAKVYEKILDIIYKIMIWANSKEPMLIGLSESVGGSPARVRKGGF